MFVLGVGGNPSYLKRMHDATANATCLQDRAVIRLSGDGVRPFLQGLLTQDVMELQENLPRWSGLLTPQGKTLFDFMLWASDEDVLIDCEADQAEALIRRLSLYRLRRKIDIACDETLAVHWSREEVDQPLDPRLPELGHRWLAPADGHHGDASATFRAHRLRKGVTEGHAELGSDRTLWLETNAGELNGVDFAKGCYIGQENTARMHYRNKVNRRLMVLPIAQSDPKRQVAAFPALDVAIDHRRVDDVVSVFLPSWLAKVIQESPA